jgi:hypothetical protein
MTAKRVVKKTAPPAKKTVKRAVSASKKPVVKKPEKGVDRRQLHEEFVDKTNEALMIRNGGATGKEPPAKMVAKSMSIIVSVGNDDRDRSLEDFITAVKEALQNSKKVQGKGRGARVTPTVSYYIVDGKVCLSVDYDKKRQNFKKGSTPPAWAGGPSPTRVVSALAGRPQAPEPRTRSAKEFDAKYGKGGVAPGTITPAMQKEFLAKSKASKDDELEEFDWEPGDVLDDSKMASAADESASRAIKRVVKSKKTSAKKTTKKQPAKKTVRRKK